MFRDKSPNGDRLGPGPLPAAGHQGSAAPAVQDRVRLQRGQDRPLGARRQVDLRARHERPDRVRDRALEVEEGVLPRRQGLEQGQVHDRRRRNPRKGVIDLAISPDGKRMAAVANFDSDAFQLYLGKPKDFLLTDAKPQACSACKVAWRSDGQEIVVVQADAAVPGGQRPARAHAGQEPRERPAAAGLLRRQPRLPAADAGVARALHELPSPALARGRLLRHLRDAGRGRGRAARARARRRHAGPARRRHDDRPRARLERRARRPQRLARARAHLPRRQRRRRQHRGRGLERRHARRRRRDLRGDRAAGRVAAADRRADAARRAPPRHGRGRAARSWCGRARASSCRRSDRRASRPRRRSSA